MQYDLEFNFNDSSNDLNISFGTDFIPHVNPIYNDVYIGNVFEDLLDIINNKTNKKVETAHKKNNIFKIIKIINKNKQEQKQRRINQNNKLGQIEIDDNDNNSNTVYVTQENKYLIFSKIIKYYNPNFLILPFFKNSKRTTNARKCDNDDIYIKIRGKFFREIVKVILNKKLENLKFERKFVFTDISQNTNIKGNIKYLNSTLEEVLKTVKSNEKAFEKLEKISGGDEELKNILNTKIEYLYKEYFNSQEFQNSIKELIDNGEYYDYIYLYIKKSEDFFDYYSIKKLKNQEINNNEQKDN